MPAKKASAAALLAEKLLRILRERRLEGRREVLTLSALAQLADPAAGPRTILGIPFQRKIIGPHLIVARRDLEAPVALTDDLPRLAASAVLLEYALRSARTASNHAASLAELKRKLTGKLQAPFQGAVQAQMEQSTLPASVGWLLLSGTRKLLFISDVQRAGEPASPIAEAIAPSTADAIPPRVPFSTAFDESFARLDRQAGGHNFVNLAELRAALPCERAMFDLGLRELRVAGRYTLSAAEGRYGLTPAEREAGITEDGILLLFVSRKSP